MIFEFVDVSMVSGRSGRYLESYLEALRFILTEFEPVSSHGVSIGVDFDFQRGSPVTPTIQKIKIVFVLVPLLYGEV